MVRDCVSGLGGSECKTIVEPLLMRRGTRHGTTLYGILIPSPTRKQINATELQPGQK